MRELARSVAVAVLGGLLVGVVITLAADGSGYPVRPWLTCALTVTAGLLLVAVYESAQRVLGNEPMAIFEPDTGVLIDRKRGGLDATVRMVERGMTDVERYPALRARLAALVDRRLDAYGVDAHLDPQRARALVGDELVDLLLAPPRRPPARAELERWLTRLEQV